MPIYELYQAETKQYFYTVSLREMNIAEKERGFIRIRIFALVAVGEIDCQKGKTLIPVKRYINADSSDYLYQTEDDVVHQRRKYSIEGVAFYGATKANQCAASVPLYRFWTGKIHIYSIDLQEGKQRAGKDAINEGIICYVWPVPTPASATTTTTTTTTSTTTTTTTTTTRDPLDNPGSCSMSLSNFLTHSPTLKFSHFHFHSTAKLFRLYRTSTDSFLFTPTYSEAKNAYETQSFNPQLSPGFASPEKPTCRCNLIPVYRVDRADPKPDQIFTTSKKEADDAVSGQGYTSGGIAYYCAERANDCGATIPYYRYRRNNSIQSHFYTTDKNEDTAVKSISEGILCYIWPQQN